MQLKFPLSGGYVFKSFHSGMCLFHSFMTVIYHHHTLNRYRPQVLPFLMDSLSETQTPSPYMVTPSHFKTPKMKQALHTIGDNLHFVCLWRSYNNLHAFPVQNRHPKTHPPPEYSPTAVFMPCHSMGLPLRTAELTHCSTYPSTCL